MIQPLPVTAGMVEYRRQAEELYAACMAGDVQGKVFVLAQHPRLRRWPQGDYPYAAVSFADIKLALAEFYYHESWPHLEAWVEEASSPGSRVSSFEAAADAILKGDSSNLRALFRLYPSLIRHRSMRKHHACLLHYIAANGVEFRDNYPENAVELLDILLAAGAEVNAAANMYNGADTVLGLVATSIHPAKAGVQLTLLDSLLAAGAIIDAPDALERPQLVVNACVANGRPEAAQYLAARGAVLDLEGAAGVGRLDVVETYFDGGGRLIAAATRAQLGAALNWACEYGHTAVATYLIDRGADPGEPINGMHALHMALLGGHLDTIRLLIERGAPLEAQNMYGGTPLGMSLWAIKHRNRVTTWPQKRIDNLAVIEALVSGGAQVSQSFLAALQWHPRSKLKTEIEQMLKRYGINPWQGRAEG